MQEEKLTFQFLQFGTAVTSVANTKKMYQGYKKSNYFSTQNFVNPITSYLSLEVIPGRYYMYLRVFEAL